MVKRGQKAVENWIDRCTLSSDQSHTANVIKLLRFGKSEPLLKSALPGGHRAKAQFLHFAYFIAQAIRCEMMYRGEWAPAKRFKKVFEDLSNAKYYLNSALNKLDRHILVELAEQQALRGSRLLLRDLSLPSVEEPIFDWRARFKELGSTPASHLVIPEMLERWATHLQFFESTVRGTALSKKSKSRQSSVDQGLVLLIICWEAIFKEPATFYSGTETAGKIIDFLKLYLTDLRPLKPQMSAWLRQIKKARKALHGKTEHERRDLLQSFLTISNGYEPCFDRLFVSQWLEKTDAKGTKHKRAPRA